jgi:probable F420-dependent oxidoreductase
VKFGIWLDFRNPPQWHRPWAEAYHDCLRLAELAEQLGFDSVWASEHHFTADGYLPSVFPALATIAARTSRIRLGSAVLLTPLHHPLRLAEDAAVVDLISAGRLDLGLGLGYRNLEFNTLGIPPTQRGRRTDETVDLLKLAWTGQPFSYDSRYFRFHDVQVTPLPVQSPHPPIWVGGSSHAAALRAGRHGCHFLPDAATPPKIIDLYRATLAEHGHDPGQFRVTQPVSVYVCDDPEQGWAEVAPHYLYAANLYREWAGRPPLPSPDQLDRSRYLVGPPATVVDALQRLDAATHPDQVIFWAKPPGLPTERAHGALIRFAETVTPILR